MSYATDGGIRKRGVFTCPALGQDAAGNDAREDIEALCRDREVMASGPGSLFAL